MVRVPKRRISTEFRWLLPFPDGIDATDDNLTWFIDGSLYDEPHHFARRTGFGIAVVDSHGSLVACGYGHPPSWIRDAAGAELWAMQVVTSMVPTCPQVVTDCLGILRTLEGHPAAATGPRKMLARTWALVAANLDDDFESALTRTTWMPSHTTVASIGVVLDSNGVPITSLMWRANRLADAFAKLAASEDRLPRQATRWVDKVARVAKEGACLLGVVTHAANHHDTTVVDANGKTTTCTRRDSSGRKGKWKSSRPFPGRDTEQYDAQEAGSEAGVALDADSDASVLDSSMLQSSSIASYSGGRANSSKARTRAVACREECRAAAEAERQTACRLAAQVLHPTGGPSASERMHALRMRIAAKAAVNAHCSV